MSTSNKSEIEKKLADLKAQVAKATEDLAAASEAETKEILATIGFMIHNSLLSALADDAIPHWIPDGMYVRLTAVYDENHEVTDIVVDPRVSAKPVPTKAGERSRSRRDGTLSAPGSYDRRVQDAFLADDSLTAKQLAKMFPNGNGVENTGQVWGALSAIGRKPAPAK